MLPKLAALYVAVQLFGAVCSLLLPVPTPYPTAHSTPTPVKVELPEYRCHNTLPFELCRFYSSGCTAKGAQLKWALEYCPDFCQLCVRDSYCKDESTACTDGSRFVGCGTSEWGYSNCHYSCGRCVRTVITCKDRISTCSGVSKEVCSGSFLSWAWNNCAKSCGLCNDTAILGPTPWLHTTNTGVKPSHGTTPYPIIYTPVPGVTPYLGPTPWPIGYTPYPGATPYPGPSLYPIGYTPSPGATPYLGPTPWPIGFIPFPGATPYPGPSRYPIGYTPSPGATPYLGPTPWPIGYTPSPGATPYPGPSRYPIGYTPSPGATPYLGPTPWPIGFIPFPGATPYPGPSRYPIGYTPSPGATPYLGETPYPIGYVPWPGATPYPGPRIGIGRETANTVTIKGYTFPEGSTVIVPLLEIQRDPNYFDEPEVFQSDRWKGNINQLAWLPFGYGQRQCLAARLALLAMKIAVIHVLRRVKFVTLPDTPDQTKTSKVAANINTSQAHLEYIPSTTGCLSNINTFLNVLLPNFTEEIQHFVLLVTCLYISELQYPLTGLIVPKQAIKLKIELRNPAKRDIS